jgi:bla regulator protein BlaR1
MGIQILEFIAKASYTIIPLLVRQILYSTVLFAVILVINALWKKQAPYWHLGLWGILLLRLVLPPNLSFPLSGRNLLNHVHVDTAYAAITEYLPFKPSDNLSMRKIISLFGRDSLLSGNHLSELSTTSGEHVSSWYIALFVLWFSGVIICSLLYLKQFAKCRLFIKNALPVQNPGATAILQDFRSRFGIRRPIRFVSSNDYLSPFTIGLFRPTIYLPNSLLNSGDTVLLQAIIAHELVHIKRHDTLWITLQNIIQILYFFHPAIWYANNQINLFRECICDSTALSICKIPTAIYGRSLLAVLRLYLTGTESMWLLPAFSNQQKRMRYRIQHLKGRHIMQKYHVVVVHVLLCLLGMFFLPMAASDAQNLGKNVEASTSVSPLNQNQTKIPEFVSPIREGYLLTKFGSGIDPATKQKRFYVGLDFAVETGANVYAAADGVVGAISWSEHSSIQKKNIIIRHTNTYKTRYLKLNKIFVEWGQQVKAGELIGSVSPTEPQFRFQVIKNYTYKDPEQYIDFKQLKTIKNLTFYFD